MSDEASDYITRVLEAATRQAQQAYLAHEAEQVTREVLGIHPGGVLCIVTDGETPCTYLELLRARGKSRMIPLAHRDLDALCAWWQSKKGASSHV